MGAEPLHQQVWWEEKAEEGVGREGRERGRVAGSRWGSWELLPVPRCGASPSVWGCSHPKALSRGWAELVPVLFTSHPTFHLFTYQNLTLQ